MYLCIGIPMHSLRYGIGTEDSARGEDRAALTQCTNSAIKLNNIQINVKRSSQTFYVKACYIPTMGCAQVQQSLFKFNLMRTSC